ncbi:hypothetical protein AKJ08_3529 [Vulgatibacter incomptus]|uniref:Uncharacterized protein n=1 Tax=Vulgatibacter incomptus TaxID=1391653 RepID=A0A0K1PHZ9_9BACT|nr:hypothetical protein AKJ08_3529 [Vulgatibacter incomptus]
MAPVHLRCQLSDARFSDFPRVFRECRGGMRDCSGAAPAYCLDGRSPFPEARANGAPRALVRVSFGVQTDCG